MMLCLSLSAEAQNVVRQGNNFTSVAHRNVSAQHDVKTNYTWTDTKGKVYPIFVGKSGACYVKRTSKAGKEYKHYLGAEVSSQVCKELGIKYTPKKG